MSNLTSNESNASSMKQSIPTLTASELYGKEVRVYFNCRNNMFTVKSKPSKNQVSTILGYVQEIYLINSVSVPTKPRNFSKTGKITKVHIDFVGKVFPLNSKMKSVNGQNWYFSKDPVAMVKDSVVLLTVEQGKPVVKVLSQDLQQ